MNWIDAKNEPPSDMILTDPRWVEGKRMSAELIVITGRSFKQLETDVRYMVWPNFRGYMVRQGKGWKALKDVLFYTYLKDLPLPEGIDSVWNDSGVFQPIPKDFKL